MILCNYLSFFFVFVFVFCQICIDPSMLCCCLRVFGESECPKSSFFFIVSDKTEEGFGSTAAR